MKLLFICNRNQWRSPTAERVYASTPGLEVRSAGLSSSAVRRLRASDIEWADEIFVMESNHKSRLTKTFRDAAQFASIHVLDIPDDYDHMDPQLIEQIRSGVDAVITANENLVGRENRAIHFNNATQPPSPARHLRPEPSP